MTLKLYKCGDDPKTLNKSYSNSVSKTCNNYEAVNDLSGYVILDHTSGIEDYNAAEINGKFYTIISRDMMIGGKIRLNLEEDVLKTFQTQIGALQPTVIRCSNKDIYNSYIADDKIITQTNKCCLNVPLGNGLFEYETKIILGVIGSDPASQTNSGNTTTTAKQIYN